MRNILKFAYKELKVFYIIEIFLFIVISLVAVFYNKNILVFNPLRGGHEFIFNIIKRYTELILYINLIVSVIMLQKQLTSPRGRLLFLSNISGKKFFGSHIIGFMLIQALFSVVGFGLILVASRFKEVFSNELFSNELFLDFHNIFMLNFNTVAIYIIILFVTTLVRSSISNYAIASIVVIVVNILVTLMFLFINYAYPAIFLPAGTIQFYVNKMFRIVINIPIILIQCILAVALFFRATKVLENKLDIV
ncbi:hypothetical protein [Clostridium paridis]|uniref:Uncharacterized protein n=1 Tax=Clostridium paridis TaxID=2803863 RepID=A0A937FEE5_9CLOT|nr:hypothetical protein [Clostridium paridis]MBL4931345.1 hypothetical protein [Clostridium paridis]